MNFLKKSSKNDFKVPKIDFEKIVPPKNSSSKFTMRFTKGNQAKNAQNCKNMRNTSKIIGF